MTRRVSVKNPYDECPVFETDSFLLRLVSESDSEDLLKCYSDGKAQPLFNTDRCSGDFCMYRIEDMVQCIKAWLFAYSEQEFIRFAIVDRSLSKAVGTVEMFGYVGTYKVTTGILRVDILSGYENARYLAELFNVCGENFFDLFGVDAIATKAMPQAVERRKALAETGFHEGSAYEGEHYFLRTKKN